MRVLCIGKSIIETTCLINEKIEEGHVIRVENKVECCGGLAGNIAYLLGKWGAETYIASMLGADDGAARIKKEYELVGVNTDYLETSFDKKTGQMVVVVNETTKNNTVLDIISNAYLKKYAFGINADIVVSDGNDFNATTSAFDKYAKSKLFLIVSEYTSETLELCKYGANIIFNRRSAEGITGLKMDFNNPATLVNIYNKLKQRFFNSEIVITVGERGCLYAINNQVKIMPPMNVGIVDTNGSKDIFAGAFIYCMGKDFGLEKSLAYANIAASLGTTKVSSRASIPKLVDVSNYYDKKFGAQNNPLHQTAPAVNNASGPNPMETKEQNPSTGLKESANPQVTEGNNNPNAN